MKLGLIGIAAIASLLLRAAGATRKDVAKVSLYVSSIEHWPTVNRLGGYSMTNLASLQSRPRQLSDLTTPCLVLDKLRTARNIERLQSRLRSLGVQLNPHLKTCKSVEIARLNHACATGAQHDRYHVVEGESQQIGATWSRFRGW